jgi:Bacterial regulatory proteins, tetR family
MYELSVSTVPDNSYKAIRFMCGLAHARHPAPEKGLVMNRAADPAAGAGGPPPLRADAKRNVAAILAAATDRLAENPDTSMAEIAAAAGVGRMTLYGHFKTRTDLLDAVLARVVAEAN